MKILLGVTGSVAAKYTYNLYRLLIAAGHEVKIVATNASLYFLETKEKEVDGGTELWLLDKECAEVAPILTDMVEWPAGGYHKGDKVGHIDLGQWAELILIAPITAETIANMAGGSAGKFLTSIVLAAGCSTRVMIAPAMNVGMWENPLVKGNLAIIEEVYQPIRIGPVEGELACGVYGMGALARHEDIVAAVNALQK